MPSTARERRAGGWRIRRKMKGFWLVLLLIGLLFTAWLVLRDLREQAAGVSGPAVVAPIGRAVDARRAQEAADRLKERRLEDAAKE